MIDDKAKECICKAIEHLSKLYGEGDRIRSNTTRALRIFEGGEYPLSYFMDAVRNAYSRMIPKERIFRRPMPYWFALLADELLEGEIGLTASEAVRTFPVNQDQGEQSKDATTTEGDQE